jgi:hypothetical protein
MGLEPGALIEARLGPASPIDKFWKGEDYGKVGKGFRQRVPDGATHYAFAVPLKNAAGGQASRILRGQDSRDNITRVRVLDSSS